MRISIMFSKYRRRLYKYLTFIFPNFSVPFYCVGPFVWCLESLVHKQQQKKTVSFLTWRRGIFPKSEWFLIFCLFSIFLYDTMRWTFSFSFSMEKGTQICFLTNFRRSQSSAWKNRFAPGRPRAELCGIKNSHRFFFFFVFYFRCFVSLTLWILLQLRIFFANYLNVKFWWIILM